MHKTLYIDVDEEITSVVDRVRKAPEHEIVIVAPKQAMLLQSIVNLKLLKRETDRRKKQLMIITQDKLGKKLIEKAGILVQGKTPNDDYSESGADPEEYEPKYSRDAEVIKRELQEEETREIGTSSFFEEKGVVPAAGNPKYPEKEKGKPGPATATGMPPHKSEKELLPKKNIENKSFKMSDIVAGKKTAKKKSAKKPLRLKMEPVEIKPETAAGSPLAKTFDEEKAEIPAKSKISMRKAEKFFRGSRKQKKDFETARVGGSAKKYFAIFAGIFVLGGIVAFSCLVLPKAVLSVELNIQDHSFSLVISADSKSSELSVSEKSIPARERRLEKEINVEYDSSGSKSGGTKATGKAVIYNKFSAEDQPLVATTRLETPDGKIFRITKNVVVPGITRVGDENRPGAIEVDVVADQPGEEMNIGPADFKIPGFQNNSSKYEKFYAKSSKPMTGGGSDGKANLVTAQDIASAKEKIGSSAKKIAAEELKKSIPSGEKFFDNAIQLEVSDISSASAAGTEAEKFEMKAKIAAKVLAFRESDVLEILKKNAEQQGISTEHLTFDQPISYVLNEYNPTDSSLKFDVKTDAGASSGLDVENFKKGVLGKSADDAREYAKKFPPIKELDVSIWPFFIKKIPLNEKRVEVKLK